MSFGLGVILTSGLFKVIFFEGVAVENLKYRFFLEYSTALNTLIFVIIPVEIYLLMIQEMAKQMQYGDKIYLYVKRCFDIK